MDTMNLFVEHELTLRFWKTYGYQRRQDGRGWDEGLGSKCSKIWLWYSWTTTNIIKFIELKK